MPPALPALLGEPRFWLTAAAATLLSLVLLWVAQWDHPQSAGGTHCTTRPTDIVVWLASAPLIGLTLATYGAFAPIQPIIGVASLAFLAGTLAYRLRQIARGCERCVGGAPEA